MLPRVKFTRVRRGTVIFAIALVLSATGLLSLVDVDAFSTAPRLVVPCRRHRPAVFSSGRTRNVPKLRLTIASHDYQEAPLKESAPSGQTGVNTARYVAAHALLGTDTKKKQSIPSLQRLESDPLFQSIREQRDRSFARLLVTTVERRLGQIDKVLEQCQTRRNNRKQQNRIGRRSDLYVQSCLRIGAAQILFLGIPAHAAVKETVDVLRQDGKIKVPERQLKYVNAVLRRISREGLSLLSTYTTPMDNIAPWLLREWNQSWGSDATEKIVESFMQQSSIDLSVSYVPGTFTDNDRFEQQRRVQAAFCREHYNAEILPHGTIRVGGNVTGVVSEWPLYNEGSWWVQDASAALPALALYTAFKSEVSDVHVVDLCAAPGGKLAQLVSLGFGNVTAIELSSKRTRRLEENIERLNMQDRCTVCIADGRKWVPTNDEQVRGVLIDVPCSATGTGSKRPDVLRRNQDLGYLLQVQEKLAQHCADRILTKGGIIVYATCSILEQESEDQVEKLLARGRNGEGAALETVPFTPGEIPGFDDAIDNNGWLRVLPGMVPGSLCSCDGFFIARLKRIA